MQPFTLRIENCVTCPGIDWEIVDREKSIWVKELDSTAECFEQTIYEAISDLYKFKHSDLILFVNMHGDEIMKPIKFTNSFLINIVKQGVSIEVWR